MAVTFGTFHSSFMSRFFGTQNKKAHILNNSYTILGRLFRAVVHPLSPLALRAISNSVLYCCQCLWPHAFHLLLYICIPPWHYPITAFTCAFYSIYTLTRRGRTQIWSPILCWTFAYTCLWRGTLTTTSLWFVRNCSTLLYGTWCIHPLPTVSSQHILLHLTRFPDTMS